MFCSILSVPWMPQTHTNRVKNRYVTNPYESQNKKKIVILDYLLYSESFLNDFGLITDCNMFL